MGQAIDISIRQDLVRSWELNKNYRALSRQYGLNYGTVRTLCKRYEASGEPGLVARYSSCGRPKAKDWERSYRLVRLVAHLHPTWGMAYIVLRIEEKYPDLPLQSVRHYQRLIRRSGKALRPVNKVPRSEEVPRAIVPHETWQVDAKEDIQLEEDKDSKACFMNFIDEKSGAVLQALPFPPQTDMSGKTE